MTIFELFAHGDRTGKFFHSEAGARAEAEAIHAQLREDLKDEDPEEYEPTEWNLEWVFAPMAMARRPWVEAEPTWHAMYSATSGYQIREQEVKP